MSSQFKPGRVYMQLEKKKKKSQRCRYSIHAWARGGQRDSSPRGPRTLVAVVVVVGRGEAGQLPPCLGPPHTDTWLLYISVSQCFVLYLLFLFFLLLFLLLLPPASSVFLSSSFCSSYLALVSSSHPTQLLTSLMLQCLNSYFRLLTLLFLPCRDAEYKNCAFEYENEYFIFIWIRIHWNTDNSNTYYKYFESIRDYVH